MLSYSYSSATNILSVENVLCAVSWDIIHLQGNTVGVPFLQAMTRNVIQWGEDSIQRQGEGAWFRDGPANKWCVPKAWVGLLLHVLHLLISIHNHMPVLHICRSPYTITCLRYIYANLHAQSHARDTYKHCLTQVPQTILRASATLLQFQGQPLGMCMKSLVMIADTSSQQFLHPIEWLHIGQFHMFAKRGCRVRKNIRLWKHTHQ